MRPPKPLVTTDEPKFSIKHRGLPHGRIAHEAAPTQGTESEPLHPAPPSIASMGFKVLNKV